MSDNDNGMQSLLVTARQRGEDATANVALPAGLDHFTAYVGLIGNAIALGKLVASEKRDLAVISAHHAIEMARIEAAFCEVETAMAADFQRNESLKKMTFESINLLIGAGQFEIASEFHRRLIDSFRQAKSEFILELRKGLPESEKSIPY